MHPRIGPDEIAVLEGARDEVHRRRADEAGDEQVIGVVVDLVRRAELLDLALVHDRDAVGQRHRLDLVMRHIDGRRLELALDVLELGPHGEAQFGVEIGERLVHEENLRLAHDGARQGGALALAAGKRARLAVEIIAELDHLRRLAHQPVMVGCGDAAHLQGEADVVVDRHVRIERIALEHHGDVAVAGIDLIDDLAIDGDLARGRILEAGDHAHGRRLAAARGAEEDHEFLVADVEIDVVDADEAAPRLRYAAQFDLSHGVPCICRALPSAFCCCWGLGGKHYRASHGNATLSSTGGICTTSI